MPDAKPRILVTRKVPSAALDLLYQACEVQLDPDDQHLAPSALRRAVADKVGLLCVVTDKIDAQLMEMAPGLKVVSNVAVGYDNVDVQAATRHGVVVTNTPGVLTATTADLVWGLLLAIARRIPEGDRYIRAGQWQEWKLMTMVGCDVYGQTLGIVGMGRIGQAVARRARGFGMQVLYHNRNRLDDALEAGLEATRVELPELLQQSDFVSLHVPMTRETVHLIGEAELRRMRPTSYLINTARGAIVDESALIRALTEGWIAGAALDVFEHEPEVPFALRQLDNVVLVPHIGSASMATRIRMAVMAAQNLLAVLRQERPPHVVNPQVYA